MKVITSPDNIDTPPKTFGRYDVFLAGGISNCPNWQKEFIEKFEMYNDGLVLINPRREDFDITNPNMSGEQIEWEYNRIGDSNVMIFWFPKETLCPITLYELGVASRDKSTIFVGCHPEYQRKFDVEKQLTLCRPDVKVVFSLENLAEQLKDYIDEYGVSF